MLVEISVSANADAPCGGRTNEFASATWLATKIASIRNLNFIRKTRAYRVYYTKMGAEENQFGLGSSPTISQKIEVAYAKNGEHCRTSSRSAYRVFNCGRSSHWRPLISHRRSVGTSIIPLSPFAYYNAVILAVHPVDIGHLPHPRFTSPDAHLSRLFPFLQFGSFLKIWFSIPRQRYYSIQTERAILKRQNSPQCLSVFSPLRVENAISPFIY